MNFTRLEQAAILKLTYGEPKQICVDFTYNVTNSSDGDGLLPTEVPDKTTTDLDPLNFLLES